MTSRSRDRNSRVTAPPSASPRESEFFSLCCEFGYQPLPYQSGWLLAAVAPEHTGRFAALPDCGVYSYTPEPIGNPGRRAAEVVWTRPDHEWPPRRHDDAG